MSSRDLSLACSHLREAVPAIIEKYNSRYSGAGLVARVGDVLRTPEEQHQKWLQGRGLPGPIVTNVDGTYKKSNHQAQDLHGENCSHAVDINVFADDGKRYVSEDRWYHALIGLAICQAVHSGGDWVKPDFPHLACPYTNE